MRDINLLADLTNYIMLELGQPMHAFDNQQVKGITVIEAGKDIKMQTLEGETHTIEPGSLVICDNTRTPVAIAGIKGGLKSAISDQTNGLLIESACFDSQTIRKASRKIGLITDASLRYEKSLDPELCPTATARMLYLLKQIDPNAKVNSSFTDVYNYKYPVHQISTTADFISKRGGVKLSGNQISDILTRLGFDVKQSGNQLDVTVPSFRGTKDVTIREDLVEEVFRMYGYDNIKSVSMNMPLIPAEQLKIHTAEYKTKHALATLFNLNEVHTYVWNYTDFNSSVGIQQTSAVTLLDSSKSGQSGLRTQLAPSLLKVVNENKNKFADLKIFEIGRTFKEITAENLVNERRILSVVLASENSTDKQNYFKLKQIVNYLANNIFKVKVNYTSHNNNSNYHPVNSCQILTNNQTIGTMGVLHPNIAKSIDKRKTFAVLELDLELMLAGEALTFALTQTSKYQSVSVDFNFVAPNSMPYSTIEQALSEFRAGYILEHSLKDVYVNQQLLPDQISYTINYIITPKNKTLEASDIEKFSRRLISEMQKIGLTLRS